MTGIICSECDVDLKDKVIMGEIDQHNRRTPIFSVEQKPIDEKTLADVVKNAEAFLATSTGINTLSNCPVSNVSITGINEEQMRIINTPYATDYEILRNDWVVPNEKIRRSIEDNNKEGYVFINCIFKGQLGKLVLCEIRKNYYSDGSTKIHYNPLTADTIKRMPE